MLLPRRLAAPIIFILTLASLHAAPAMPEWKDAKGGTFRGEPVEAIGPFLLFRTGATSSKVVPMRAVPAEDCVRFYQAIAGRAPRAERWSEAKGEASGELVGRIRRVDNRQLKSIDLSKLAEPELLIVIFASHNVQGGAWRLLDNLPPFVNRVQRVYPGRVAAVVLGTSRAGFEPRWLPARAAWFAVDPDKQSQLKLLSRFAPMGGFVMMLMTREGVPLFAAPANDIVEVTKFVDGASDILWQLNPDNPRTARDRAHYLNAVRPIQFAEGKAGPVLLAEPFRVDGLRRHGVKRIDASVEVGADGAVAKVEMRPTSEVAEPLRPALAETIRRNALFISAVENGQPVTASYDYSLKIAPLDKQLAADAAWVTGEARIEVPIKSWLILKPVHVSEQIFSTVDRVSADGTVMLKAVTAGDPTKVSNKSQMTAFNSDWFTETGGPGSVRPMVGAKQEVDGEKLTWKKVTPHYGLVDFLGNAENLDYCIGYAWTEFEVPEETDAWLGIGSDDGLKVWLNGELVNDTWVQRTSRLDDDVVPVRLKKGANQFLIKIQNAKGQWSFTTRLRVRGS